MAIATVLKKNWKEEKTFLLEAISSLKKSMNDYKAERKLEWKSFKNKYKDEMGKVENSLKKMTHYNKKES